MLVEGAIADWSAIYLRTSVLTGPGLAALGYAVFSGAMAGGRLTGDYLTGKLGRGHLVCYGALLAAAGLVFVLLFGNAGWALVGFTCAGAGLATIIPNTFAAAGNIEGSAPGPSLAVVTTAGYVGFLAGPPLIGFIAQLSTIRAALWILVVLSALSAFASTELRPSEEYPDIQSSAKMPSRWHLRQRQRYVCQYSTSVLLRKEHRIRVALAGADAGLFERYPAEGTPKLTAKREAQRASYLDLPVKTHDP
jgi:MFS family permease